MILEIYGLTGYIFVDIILIWVFVTTIICFGLLLFGTLFIDDITIIDDKKIIGKIVKLKNDDRHLYKFAKKLSQNNIDYLYKYKMIRLDRAVISPNFNYKVKPTYVNNNEKRLYEKIESILYYYALNN